MKITILSHDLWGFGKFVHNHLIKLNHDSTYINCLGFEYKYVNSLDRTKNFFYKNILKRNIKKEYRTNQILNTLNNLNEKQDYILIFNPGDFHPSTLELAKQKTKKLIAYNYDSIKRVALPINPTQYFDTIYCFDNEDVTENDFLTKITNYTYIDKQELGENFKNKAFIILSKDKQRNIVISKIADEFERNNIKNIEFILIDKPNKKLNQNITFQKKRLTINEIISKVNNAEILIDIVRKDQVGLSFRIFEAMAHQKKLITTNANIKNYDFYNENNILVIDSENPIIPQDFLNNKYIPLSDDIYNKYTLDTWCKTVFNIN